VPDLNSERLVKLKNIFNEVYELIDEFICRQENIRLKAGTGSYSTLFRGTLSGSTETMVVEKAISENPVRVLWLGSNPNVPESLDLITKSPNSGHYNEFLKQKQNGHFSEVVRDPKTGNLIPGWDPINHPSYHWRFYTEIFEQLFGQGHILMANYVPWGSRDFSTFIREMTAFDRDLLNRVLHFSTMLNQHVINHFRPELIVAPKSIFCQQLEYSHLSLQSPKNKEIIQIKAKVPFNFSVNDILVGTHKTKLLVCPHPSYTSRVGRENRLRVQMEVAKAIDL
jgi:hypothetical protein